MKTNINIHNRFDFELRDAVTGELKQKAQAENIVLNRMYERLCSMNSYFSNIVFGTGTGTLSPARTTLFNRIGNATASAFASESKYPISFVTKRCILAPESFIGQTFTEVGISETTTNINTHALITDSEGNPISITKSDTDVLTIYATVFIEFVQSSWSHPSLNSVLTYLINGTTSLSSLNLSTYRFGIIQNKSVSLVADLANKKTTFPTTRFGISESNGLITTLGLGNSFFKKIENENQLVKNTNVGSGNFTIRPLDSVVSYKKNNVDALYNSFITGLFENIQTLSGVGSTTMGVSMSGDIIVTASNVAPFFTVQKLNPSTGLFENIQTLSGVGSQGNGATISGDTIVTASTSAPFFTVQKLNPSTGLFENIQTLSGVGSEGYGVSISGDTIVTVSNNTPFFTVHKLNPSTGLFEKLQDLIGVGSTGRGVSMSGDIIVTASNVAPFFTVQKLNPSTGLFENIQTLSGVGSQGNGVSISGDIIVTASNVAPFFTVQKLNPSTGLFENIQTLSGVGTNGRGVTISGDIIVTASTSAPFFTVHKLNPSTGLFENIQTLSGVGGSGNGVSISGDTVVTSSNNPIIFIVHKLTEYNNLTASEAFEPTDVFELSYNSYYINKTSDHVLDVSAEIQWGEGAV